MNIDQLKTMSYSQIQSAYATYLNEFDLKESVKNTYRTDALYLLRCIPSEDFWMILEDSNFEEIAEQKLREVLSLRSKGNIDSNIKGYIYHLKHFRRFAFSNSVLEIQEPKAKKEYVPKNKFTTNIPTPCVKELEKYLLVWDDLEDYRLQESALNHLFFSLAPTNKTIEDILLKVSTLNDFYSTNIFKVFPVAKHILNLDIDNRLLNGDPSLVDDIKDVEIKGKIHHFYSFATKYCSHHRPMDYPIYDSYVDEILKYFRKRDGFCSFSNDELKQYPKFKQILIQFQIFYKLESYSLKQLDQYLWQLGKKYLPKNYNK